MSVGQAHGELVLGNDLDVEVRGNAVHVGDTRVRRADIGVLRLDTLGVLDVAPDAGRRLGGVVQEILGLALVAVGAGAPDGDECDQGGSGERRAHGRRRYNAAPIGASAASRRPATIRSYITTTSATHTKANPTTRNAGMASS